MTVGTDEWENFWKTINQPVKIIIKNECEEAIQEGEEEIPSFKWSIFIDDTEPPSFIEKIDQVTYHIHHDYNPNVVHIPKNAENPKFGIESEGYYEFTVAIDITIKGRTARVKHNLKLSKKGNRTELKLKDKDFSQ
jgi:transcription initiation factor IIF auxiliary subunit